MKGEIAFIISDASHSPSSNVAGIGIVDLLAHQSQKTSLENIDNSLDAEKYALSFAIDYAKNKKYKHVVFVYDALGINLEPFKECTKNDFETAQFLWLSRKCTYGADRIAKFARNFKEEKIKNGYKRKYLLELSDEQLLLKFRSYEDIAIIKAFIKISNEKQKSMLQYYFENFDKYLKSYMFEINKEELIFFQVIYYFLSEHKILFAKYVVDQCVDVAKDFKSVKPRDVYLEMVEQLIQKLDTKK